MKIRVDSTRPRPDADGILTVHSEPDTAVGREPHSHEDIDMRFNLLLLAAIAPALGACTQASASDRTPNSPNAAASAAVRDEIHWGPAPAVFPKGAEFAVLQGDPGKAEPFTVRLRFPDGYKLPPHIHPTTENVTVLEGTLLAAMGTQFVESDLKPYQRDEFISLPADHAHYVMARGLTVVQVHALGPFALTYVNSDGSPVK